MAAYAALASLMNLIEQIQTHPRPPVTLDEEQAESLKKRIAYFQEFLEAYNFHYANQEMEQLRNNIADAAYAAEDFIESFVVNQILRQSTSHAGENIISLRDFFEGCSGGCSDSLQSQIAHQLLDQVNTEDEAKISSIHLYRALQKLMEHMDFLKKEVMDIKGKIGTQDRWQRFTPPPAVSSTSQLMKEKTMVGQDDVLHEILDKLTGKPSGRQIISISGMGGIGKTTLARNIYRNQLIVEHFNIFSWVTISQELNIREILLELLCRIHQGSRESLSPMTDEELREKLYKSLCGRRYLIIMDDMWNNKVWDQVKFLFPDNSNGSRILITTRLSNLAKDLNGSYAIKVDLLDRDKSWSLFCKTVFGEEDCPAEFERIGMMIAENCKGLPLSIIVIGGLLAKFKQEKEYWEYIAENINSNVALEENELCLKILRKSYDQLPSHLKACFLYMGVFPEDSKIRVSELIKLWVVEGFLKPMRDKSLEENAEECLNDLIDRNLIMINERGSAGKLEFVKIHDLLRDLCLRQAQKEKFLYLASEHCLDTLREGIYTQRRRIVVHRGTSKYKILGILNSELATRSLILYSTGDLPSVKFRLLRVLKDASEQFRYKDYNFESFGGLVNLGYLDTDIQDYHSMRLSKVSQQYLQTLIIRGFCYNYFELAVIWKMRQLRHVKFCQFVPFSLLRCSQLDEQDDVVWGNLQTLVGIRNFKCTEGVVKRIPNVRKLVISYYNLLQESEVAVASDYCLNNLVRLHKLETFGCYFNPIQRPCRRDLLHNLRFPNSLKKLAPLGTRLYWEDISTKIGSLPHLQVLKLKSSSVVGPEWETVEGQFPNLKYLLIEYLEDLKYWSTEGIHFPRLELLVLHGLGKLKEIPSCVGEITTLQSIRVEYCSDCVIISAKQILDEQEDLGNEDLHVRVLLEQNNDQYLETLASHNFQVKTFRKEVRTEFEGNLF